MSRKAHTHTGSVRLTSRVLCAGSMLLVGVKAQMQVPTPVLPLGTRQVHRCIAPPTFATVLNGSSPLFQYPDQLWNHGEGFVTTGNDADQGGWFNEDDGSGLTQADIHMIRGWQSFYWTSPVHPNSGQMIRHFVGHLRPSGLVLPTTHPLYGQVPAGQGPLNNGTYVDQGAFEIFAPPTLPGTTTKIVVVINNWETTSMPNDYLGRSNGWNVYHGYFSPDGLIRSEKTRTMTGFLANDQEDNLRRPPLAASLVANASYHAASYWPIAAYAVPTVPGRQTTLNEQRNMQLLQAVLLLLQQTDVRNPLYPQSLTAQEVEQRVVVVFAGGSNGGHQSMWSAMRYPGKIHGSYSDVISPSIQRLFGEHDLGYAFSQQAGLPEKGATVTEWDFMNWGRYAWNQGYWLHDLSFARRQARNEIYRPACFRVGDEDITSTGTDWVRLVSGGAYVASGQSAPSVPSNWPISSKLAWTVSKLACHGTTNATSNPYNGQTTWQFVEIADELIEEAIVNRSAEVGMTSPPTPGTIGSQIRGSQLRGVDDPHEWALGRVGTAMSPSGSALTEDSGWFDTVQPGAAGTWLGNKEAMLIVNHRLYVVGAEGVVTAFEVDLTPGNRQQLLKIAQTHDAGGRPMSLGLEGCALATVERNGGLEIVVGTRRHIYTLNPSTLSVTAGPVELPWEVAQPHHMKVGDVLPTAVHSGAEIVFASVHGGLVFYTKNLAPVYEWPEPGIVDFAINGSTVTILSQRGVVADVVFDAVGSIPSPRLVAASRPIPRRLQQHVTTYDPLLDSPSQGTPLDLELMRMNWNVFGGGEQLCAIGLWTGDEDGFAVRAYLPGQRITVPYLANLVGGAFGRGGADIATCVEASTYPPASTDEPGDHLLVLLNDRIYLYDQYGAQLGWRELYFTTLPTPAPQPPNPYTPFGRQSHVLAVGDLVDNASTGSVGPYDQEVVVATQSGALLWLHINDIYGASGNLGQEYRLTVGGASSNIQPRTNQSLSATWAMTQRSGDTSQLHLLDQRGGYWTVNGSGGVQLRDRELAAVGARGWDDLGNRTAGGVPIQLSSQGWSTSRLEIAQPIPSGLSFADHIRPKPWCPIDVVNVSYEKSGGPYVANNWMRYEAPSYSFQGFVVHAWGGCVIDELTLGREVWSWAVGTHPTKPNIKWGNLLQGIRFPPAGPGSNWQATGVWASTAHSTNPNVADRLDYHDLRSFVGGPPIMTDQAIQAVDVPNYGKVLVLGCPGGKVRIVSPGAMGGTSNGHAVGTVLAETTDDFGYGGGALAVKPTSGGAQIWFGTLYGPTPRPVDYALSPQGALLFGEEATGAVHSMTWSSSNPSLLAVGATRALSPAANSRGGYGVVGLCVADLLAQSPGDELITATLAGDIIVMNASSLVEIWRTHVPGAAGFFNSIRVANLNAPADALNELYVAGSLGVWRFTQAGEAPIP